MKMISKIQISVPTVPALSACACRLPPNCETRTPAGVTECPGINIQIESHSAKEHAVHWTQDVLSSKVTLLVR
jgi:hypothetical protein